MTAGVPGGVVLVGANPGVRLFDGDELTVFASVWAVTWSEQGRGNAVVLWHDGQVRVLGADLTFSRWLAEYFTRHFPEVAGLPWPQPRMERADVSVELDLGRGMRARAGDVAITMSGVLARRTFATDAFDLGGTPHRLSLVLAPVRHAEITVAGRRVPGHVQLGGPPDRPTSSAFVTDAEVWCR